MLRALLSTNQIAGFFKVQYLINEGKDKFKFLYGDKHQSFARVQLWFTYFIREIHENKKISKYIKYIYFGKYVTDCSLIFFVSLDFPSVDSGAVTVALFVLALAALVGLVIIFMTLFFGHPR